MMPWTCVLTLASFFFIEQPYIVLHTRTRACVLLLRGWFLFGLQNLSGACYPSLCIYSHAANTLWVYFRKEESGNRKEREQAEAFVMRCKAVAVDREPDRCGNSVWRPQVSCGTRGDHPRSRNHPLCWTLMDNFGSRSQGQNTSVGKNKVCQIL